MNLSTTLPHPVGPCRMSRWRMHTPMPPEVDPDAPLPDVDPDPQPDDDEPENPSRAPEGDPPAKPPPVYIRCPL
ncbi:hypothetical protein P0D88_09625 [Paraburkholderia sp. RL18-103-BIB-C]|uniref:hypothetical protein n=1 Tax=Paraburkholderia sp. RL18-103-BIB-C TaxID=3031637 RepID=UPI0038BBA400